MENQDNLTDNTLAGAAHVDAADGGAAVADALSLAELNQYLGKDFKDKATALKSLKDTFSFVGKKQETPAPQPTVSADLETKVQALEDELFYSKHPEHAANRDIIKAMGGKPSEVIGSEAYKTLFERVKAADEVQKRQSVLNPNSRVAAPSTYRQEAVNIANSVGSSGDDVAAFFAAKINENSSQ